MPLCTHCREVIDDDDEESTDASGNRFHSECFMRLFVGSLAHVERRCCCYDRGSTEGDPPGMTTRQAAQAAYKEWQRRQRGG